MWWIWPAQRPCPLAGMSIAIGRLEPGMKLPLVPSEALTPMQALLGYTQGAAYAPQKNALPTSSKG